MKHSYRATESGLTLRPLEHGDIESLRNWRNDPVLSGYLSDIGFISSEMQEAWYRRYLDNKTELIFAVDIEKESGPELIGSIALSGLDGKSGESGKLLIGNRSYQGRGLAKKALKSCLKIAFETLGLRSCTAYAHPLNPPSFVTYVNSGFRITGSRPFKDGSFEYRLEMTRGLYELYRKGAVT